MNPHAAPSDLPDAVNNNCHEFQIRRTEKRTRTCPVPEGRRHGGLPSAFLEILSEIPAFCRNLVWGGIDDAKDIMQDVFIKIWRYRDRLDENLSLYNYIYVLTKREVLNYLRGRRIPVALPEDDSILSEESVERTVSGKEMEAVVTGIIREMPQPKRRIFLMSRFNGMSVKDIAGILSLSVRSVNYHIETAKEFLRKRLADMK